MMPPLQPLHAHRDAHPDAQRELTADTTPTPGPHDTGQAHAPTAEPAPLGGVNSGTALLGCVNSGNARLAAPPRTAASAVLASFEASVVRAAFHGDEARTHKVVRAFHDQGDAPVALVVSAAPP